MVQRIRAIGRDGTPHGEMAVLVRTNAQLPAVEAALGAAGIPFHVRGERFFARPEVRRADRRRADARPAARTRRGRGRRAVGTMRSLPSTAGTRLSFQAGRCLRAGPRRPARHSPASRGRSRTPCRRASPCSSSPRISCARIRTPGSTRSSAEIERRTEIEAGGRRDRGRAADLPPGQGPRVGRRLPPRARGRHAADPPGDRTGRAGRGAAAPLRRDHPGAPIPLVVVGRQAHRGDGSRGPAQPVAVPRWARAGDPAHLRAISASGGEVGRGAGGGSGGASKVGVPAATGRRCRTRSVPGARPVPRPMRSPRSSSSTTRRSRRSPSAGRDPSPSSAACPGIGPTKLDRYGEEIIGVVATTEPDARPGPPGA